MDTLDAPLFDDMMNLLGPAGACRLAVLSKDLKELVETNGLWKTWCEREYPSLTTSPAKELVEALYGTCGYKKLFGKLTQGRGRAPADGKMNKDAAVRKNKGSGLSAYIMLMDVHLRGEDFAFCSAECSEMEVGDWQSKERNRYRYDDLWREDACKAVVRAFNQSGAREDASSAVKHVVSPSEQQTNNWPKPELQELLLFSWKLMRKTDGKVLILLDYEPASLTPEKCHLRPEYRTDSDRFQASAPIRDPEGSEWTLFKALMRLRCCREDPKVCRLDGWTYPSPQQKQREGYAVEAGIARDSFGSRDLDKFDINLLLKNPMLRWY